MIHDVMRLIGLGLVWGLFVIIPGPDFVATAHISAARTRRAGLGVALGIATGTAIWATSALLGLSMMLTHARWMLDVVRIAGGGFLAWIGIAALYRSRNTEFMGADVRIRTVPWLTGLFTNLANPKAAIFWTTLFAAVLPIHASASLDVEAVVEVVLIPAAWYSIVAYAFSLHRMATIYQASRRRIERVTGCVYLALAGLVWADR